MDTLLDFSGKTAIITGAGTGFGRLLAQALHQRKCNLVLTDINSDELNKTVELLSDDPSRVRSLVANVAEESSSQEAVKIALQDFGKLDIAVNNAGIAHTQLPTHELTEEIFDSQFAVNVKGVAFGMKHQVIAMLANKKGHILNVSSLAGLGGAPKAGAYVAAKHAVSGITKTAAVEYARYGVQVNAICPFFSPTNIMNIDGLLSEDQRNMLARGTPMKRLADPQEIVNVMVLMLSPANTYMNGQTIAVDGGVTAW